MTLENIPHDVSAWKLKDMIAELAPTYFQRIKVIRENIFENGAFLGYQWAITFYGLVMDFPQFEASTI